MVCFRVVGAQPALHEDHSTSAMAGLCVREVTPSFGVNFGGVTDRSVPVGLQRATWEVAICSTCTRREAAGFLGNSRAWRCGVCFYSTGNWKSGVRVAARPGRGGAWPLHLAVGRSCCTVRIAPNAPLESRSQGAPGVPGDHGAAAFRRSAPLLRPARLHVEPYVPLSLCTCESFSDTPSLWARAFLDGSVKAPLSNFSCLAAALPHSGSHTESRHKL